MSWKKEFPIFDHLVQQHKSIVYLDNAATTHKPFSVIEREKWYYTEWNSNIHRANHHLAQVSTELFEDTREAVRAFIHANKREEIIFTRGTTESLNLLATSVLSLFSPGDNIILTWLEHHSNIVPWQFQAKLRGIEIRVAPISEEGFVEVEQLKELVDEKTRLISLTHVSNVLGTVQPIQEIVQFAHKHGILVAVDGAQAIAHLPVNVSELDCDFYAFSAHKMYGPTGVGVLYGKEKWLEMMPPYQCGGEMIDKVSFEETTYNDLPYKFEAGTPNIAGVVAFKEAILFVQKLFEEGVVSHEEELLTFALEELNQFPELIIYGTRSATKRTSVISFNHPNMHAYDVGLLLDKMGVAVRTGHHCAQPLLKRLKADTGTVRLSLACYNEKEDILHFVEAFKKVQNMLL